MTFTNFESKKVRLLKKFRRSLIRHCSILPATVLLIYTTMKSFDLPAFEGIILAHHFDQWVSGWFGHQRWDSATAWHACSKPVTLYSIWTSWMF